METMLGGHLLHGCDYNPEQWLEYPEVFEEDLRLMKAAEINCVTLGVFSWSVLEPEEGVYDFEWLDRIIRRLGEADIQVILATPSGAMPHWLTQKYPEVMQVRADGRRNLPGKRHNFCYTSPIMREKIKELDVRLSEKFGQRDNVILWHISNELGGNFEDSACYCEKCQAAFRRWLKKRYGTLKRLNQAYWGRFWSHSYTDWEQIHSPAPHGEWTVTALEVDWRRFVTEQMSSFCLWEINAVRTHSKLPVTTNFMDFFKGLDYHRLQRILDIVSWDSYPQWHAQKDEVPAAVRASAGHHMMRAMKKQPFLLMESVPSGVNWRTFNPLKRPGMHMLSSMQAIACGSASVQYFQWRKGRGSYEKFHGAVLDHKNGSCTRTFADTARVGRRLKSLTGLVEGTVNRPRVAVIFDWENWWALENTTGPRLDIDYVSCVLAHYAPFWEMGIDVDFVGMDDCVEGYTLVAAPLNYMYKDGYADKIRRFVGEGGIYVTTYFSGMTDESDLCFIGHHPLEDVLGIIQEEIDAPGPEFENSMIFNGISYPVGNLRELIHVSGDTQVLACYTDDYVKGMPALTAHSFGRGTAYYIAAEPDRALLNALYKEAAGKAGLKNPLGIPLPYGVTVSLRTNQDGGGLIFVMNFKNEPAELCGFGQYTDGETGEIYKHQMILEPFSCRILISEETV